MTFGQKWYVGTTDKKAIQIGAALKEEKNQLIFFFTYFVIIVFDKNVKKKNLRHLYII